MSDITAELTKLHILKGADYSRQVERIARMGVFHPVEGEVGIYSVGGECSDDYWNLLEAARKAVSHGYKVYILPNPNMTKTPDFIFARKGTYRPYELKTITGRYSVSYQLYDSIGQSNRVLIHLMVNYKASLLAFSIKRYFEQNKEALEVLIFKGHKIISVTREFSKSKLFYGLFMKKFFK